MVFTGWSGSGKSSLAFDTIYAEGQRRYVESLSSYRVSFWDRWKNQMSIILRGFRLQFQSTRKRPRQNPRSTVGKVPEIYDYLRLLWARIGTPHCPKCGKEIHQQTIDQIIDQLMGLPEGTKLQVLAPVVRQRKGEHVKVLKDAQKSGYVRVRVDGNLYDLSEEIKLEKNKKHSIEIVVDRVVVRADARSRLTDSVEAASALSGGLVLADVIGGEVLTFSQNYACEDCNISIEELTPRMFSFNNPYGACPTCTGLGVQMKIDPDRIIETQTCRLQEVPFMLLGGPMPSREVFRECTMMPWEHGTALHSTPPFAIFPKKHEKRCFMEPRESRWTFR